MEMPLEKDLRSRNQTTYDQRIQTAIVWLDPPWACHHTRQAGNHLLKMPLISATREPLKHRNQQNTKYLHNTFQKTKQSNIAQIEPCDATWLGQVVFKIARSTSVSGTNLIKLKHSGQLHGASMPSPKTSSQTHWSLNTLFGHEASQRQTAITDSTTEALRNKTRKFYTPSTCQATSPKFLVFSFGPLWLESPAINWSHEYRWQAFSFWMHPINRSWPGRASHFKCLELLCGTACSYPRPNTMLACDNLLFLHDGSVLAQYRMMSAAMRVHSWLPPAIR